MKKKLAILLSLILCLLCLPSAALAAETDEMVPVVVKTPEGWEAPCLWAWADDGTNAFAAWPGEELEPLDGGWYYAYVPGFVQNIIVNANNDAEAPVQTEGIAVEAGKEVWLTIGEDATAEIAYESQARIEIPEYVEKFVVHAYVPLDWKTANLWAWSAPDGTNAFASWPGESLVQDGDWYTIQAPGWINSVIVNANESSVQTTDLSVEPGKDIWVVVNGPEDAVVSYEEPSDEPAPVETTEPAPSEEPAPTAEPEPAGGSNTGLIVGGVAVAAVAVGGGAALAVSKKKKK